MIWARALVSRMIKISTYYAIIQVADSSSWRTEERLRPNIVKVPAVLQTSKESRAIALRSYSLSFAKELYGKQIYVDFERDHLVFEDFSALVKFYGIRKPGREHLKTFLQQEPTNIEKKLRFLSIGTCLGDGLATILSRFQNLTEVTLKKRTISDLIYEGVIWYDVDNLKQKVIRKWETAAKKASNATHVASKLPEILQVDDYEFCRLFYHRVDTDLEVQITIFSSWT